MKFSKIRTGDLINSIGGFFNNTIYYYFVLLKTPKFFIIGMLHKKELFWEIAKYSLDKISSKRLLNRTDN